MDRLTDQTARVASMLCGYTGRLVIRFAFGYPRNSWCMQEKRVYIPTKD